jgi:virulence-associated protein VagC
MSAITAKVFRAGNSKALRLPRALEVKVKTYEVTPTPDGFIVTDPAARARRLKALRRLRGLPPMKQDWPRP